MMFIFYQWPKKWFCGLSTNLLEKLKDIYWVVVYNLPESPKKKKKKALHTHPSVYNYSMPADSKVNSLFQKHCISTLELLHVNMIT